MCVCLQSSLLSLPLLFFVVDCSDAAAVIVTYLLIEKARQCTKIINHSQVDACGLY